MAKLKQLQENEQDIFPVTHEDGVLDDNGVSIIVKLNNHIENHPSCEGSSDVTKSYVDSQDKVLDDKITVLSDKVDGINMDSIGVLTSPNGTKFYLKVADDGSLYTERDTISQDLPEDFPKYIITGQGISEEYLVCPHSQVGRQSYIFIMDKYGDVKWYKKVDNIAYNFRKYINADGKIRYAYFIVTDDEKFNITNGYFDTGKLVIMDENLNIINDNVKLKSFGNITEEFYNTENHDYLFIDDDHFIIPTYYPQVVNNIPGLEGTDIRITSTILQEQKNGEVIWQWDSTEHLELYSANHSNNNYANSGISQDGYLDYLHFNSIQRDKRDGNLLISMREMGLMKLNKENGEILWIIGKNRNDISKMNSSWLPFQQHDARYNDDYSITCFDNAGCSTNNTRICRYWIDEETKEILDFEELVCEKVKSGYMGSAKKNNGDLYEIAYGGGFEDMAFEVFDFGSNEQKFKMAFDDGHDLYRIYSGFENNNTIDTDISIEVEKIIMPSELSILLGEEINIDFSYKPVTATNVNIVWSSSNEEIATVNQLGIITPISEGTCTIVAKSKSDNNVKNQCTVKITSDNSVDEGYLRLKLDKNMNISMPDWAKVGDYTNFEIKIWNGFSTNGIDNETIKSKFNLCLSELSFRNYLGESVYAISRLLFIRLKDENANSVEGFKKYISENNIYLDIKYNVDGVTCIELSGDEVFGIDLTDSSTRIRYETNDFAGTYKTTAVATFCYGYVDASVAPWTAAGKLIDDLVFYNGSYICLGIPKSKLQGEDKESVKNYLSLNPAKVYLVNN